MSFFQTGGLQPRTATAGGPHRDLAAATGRCDAGPMVKYGSAADARGRRRSTGGQNGDPWSRSAEDPFAPAQQDPATADAPSVLGGWAAMTSYLELEPVLVAEMARAAMSSGRVVALTSGEVGVGAMLASLAVRGEDALLDELLPLQGAEIRVHRYTLGRLDPISVHPVAGGPELLRALALCAASATYESWQAVAHDGHNPPVGIGSAQRHELRWLQPTPIDAPGNPPWMRPTTQDPPPGTSIAAWQHELLRVAEPRSDSAPRGPALGLTLGGLGGEALGAGESERGPSGSGATRPLPDPSTFAQLRDDRTPDEIARGAARLAQVDVMSRQLEDLTALVEGLAESVRSLTRHQWDNSPPPGFWLKVQRADDEVRRALEDLAGEVRSRTPPPTNED